MDELKADKRLELHSVLVKLVDPNKVYFQPPSSIKMTYPCIVYELNDIDVTYANSIKYKNKKRYMLTVIDQDPDSEIPNKLLTLEYSSFDRHFITDNLNHYTFTLYF